MGEELRITFAVHRGPSKELMSFKHALSPSSAHVIMGRLSVVLTRAPRLMRRPVRRLPDSPVGASGRSTTCRKRRERASRHCQYAAPPPSTTVHALGIENL